MSLKIIDATGVPRI